MSPAPDRSCLGLEDPRYPILLRSIPDPPSQLHARGEIDLGRPALAFVGSRRPTPYGLRMARRLAGDAAAAGWVVVSGLARGIDTEAHRAALAAGGRTWAVLGSGLDRIYPPENAALALEIASAGGCCLSEFPPETPPLPGHFPRRNRIISGLSLGVVVVEGESRSGSLITARLAAEQGREVLAVPGPADSRLSSAPHWLISQGAALARSLADIVEALGPGGERGWPGGLLPPTERSAPAGGRSASAPSAPRGSLDALPLEQRKILEWLGPDSRTLEELGEAMGLDLPRLSTVIFQMEIAGLVAPLPGQRYAQKTS